MKTAINYIVLCSLFMVSNAGFLYSQNSKVDSLDNRLQKLSKNDTARINLLNEIAFLVKRSDLDKMYTYAKLADSLSAILDYKSGQAESLKNLGVYHFFKSDHINALSYYKRSLQVYEEIGGLKGISSCSNNIGGIYWSKGDYPNALKYFQKSMKIDEQLGDHYGVGVSLKNIGIIHRIQNDYSKSLDNYHKALKIFQELNNKRATAGTLNNIGVVYRFQQDNPKALEYFIKSLRLKEEIGDKKGISATLNNIGLIHFDREEYAQAILNFQRALIIKQELGDKSGSCLTYLSFSKIYLKTKQYAKALNYALKCYEVANAHGLLDILKDANLQLSEVYSETNRYQKAYSHYVAHKVLSDSLYNEENIKKITGLELQYKFEKEKELAAVEQAKKDAIKEEELKRQKVIRNTFVAGLGVMIIISLLIFRNFRMKQKTVKILSRQKKQISKQNEEIKLQAKKLQSTNEKLLELNEFKKGMTSMIVHDLKNPLNGILNVSKTYSYKTQVDKMKQTAKQMLNMVLNILDVNKFEDSKMMIHKNSLSLFNFTNQSIAGIQFLADQKNIAIENCISQNITIKADEEIIDRVFTNLLTNAIKFTPNNGKIIIRANITKEKPERIKISVSDTGIGIPADKIHLVFEKFEQVAAMKSGHIRSTGLGLTFCKMAIEAHGGQIDVTSEVGKGTTVWFTLPEGEKTESKNDVTVEQSAKEKLEFNHEEKQIIIPFVEQLKNTEIYKLLELRRILRKIDNESENIIKWKYEIGNAIGSGNQEKFNELLNI